ncbi:DnaA N-terminal domain-containing protein [Archangium violaceum]|uniref:DnaA N-terminal domain-containing protein n=1 Tax=Archangium violaceum TaxID=83451 RepID=UPI0036D9E870
MAGLDWVQVDVGFPMSLPVVCAARTLGMERRAFVGAMVELQIWAVQALPSGRFEPFGLSGGRSTDASADMSMDEAVWQEAVEGAVRWTGAPGAFWDALLRAGILMREGDSVRFTLCDRYVQVLEKRSKEAERKRRERAAKAAGASAGRPVDMSGTSSSRKRKEKESEKKTSSSAAALETGSSGGRLIPVSLPSDEEVPVAPVDATPVQLALPGTHMVPVSSPPRDVWRAPESEDAASEPSPVEEESPARAAAAFFATCQEERGRALPGLPSEEQPKAWASWYRGALRKVGGNEGRLLEAWRGYLHSDWGRSREPRCTAQAFCTPRVWSRYLEPVKREDPSELSGAPFVDVSTEAGRHWRECLAWLHDHGKRYALTWLAQARAVGVEDGRLVLEVPDAHFRQWVQEHYGQMVEQLARELGLEGVCWRLAEGVRAPLLG